MGLRGLLTVVFSLCVLDLRIHGLALAEPLPDFRHRVKRQEPDPAAQPESEEYAVDYAGNDNNDDPPKEEPADTFTDTQNNDINEDKFDQANDFNENKFEQNNDFNEDKFGTDTFDDAPKEERKKSVEESEESKPKKKVKKHKYLKKTLEFLKRVLDPNKLMENAYITEMLRRFSHAEDPEHEESSEEVEEVHTPKPLRKRRGRPKNKDKVPPGIKGIIKKGVMTIAQMELDKKKLKRRVRLIKRIARKAKRPLKTAVKIFLSSRNQGAGGYGGGGFTNNNY